MKGVANFLRSNLLLVSIIRRTFWEIVALYPCCTCAEKGGLNLEVCWCEGVVRIDPILLMETRPLLRSRHCLGDQLAGLFHPLSSGHVELLFANLLGDSFAQGYALEREFSYLAGHTDGSLLDI